MSDAPNPPTEHADADQNQSSEVYNYEHQHRVYGISWSNQIANRFAVSSFVEECQNYVEVLQLDQQANKLTSISNLRVVHPYPPTKLLFAPKGVQHRAMSELMATTCDYLRVYSVGESQTTLERKFDHATQSTDAAPFTSFDWNQSDTKLIAACSIDTSVSILDIEAGKLFLQLIAHDREIYDVVWSQQLSTALATASADGSIRLYDTRQQDKTYVFYENQDPKAEIVRVAWNKLDGRYIAAVHAESHYVHILDLRFPAQPVSILGCHKGCVNAVAWSPVASNLICTVADDCMALIWDISSLSHGPIGISPGLQQPVGMQRKIDPLLAYSAQVEVNNLAWSALQPEWVAICLDRKSQILKVKDPTVM